jgi:TetR/AcrR family transcriptional regulator, tetracycline repressor protein
VPVSQDQIVETAMVLLERDGIEGVSFRKLAAELGVSAPTLYWHVDSKRRLLDLMAERLMAETHRRESLSPYADEPWWEWLERRTTAMYETLVSHRDAPRVVAGNRPTVAALPAIEVALSTLVGAGFEPAEAVEVIVMLGAFVTGCALELQAEAERGLDHRGGELGPAIRGGQYPTLLRALADHRRRGEHVSPHTHMFDNGLRMIITGLRASVGDRSSRAVAAVMEDFDLADALDGVDGLDISASDFANAPTTERADDDREPSPDR